MSQTALELISVDKTYGGRSPVVALKQVDLAVNTGEFVAIAGPSGSGKSTLLNIMGTLDRPSSGKVLVGGRDTAAMSDRQLSKHRARSIGFVFQSFHLIETASVQSNVSDGLIYRGVGRKDRRRQAIEALKRVGLDDKATVKPSVLSGGQRQRVAIARAIVGEPDIVLADEPTGNLDSSTSEQIVSLLADLNRDHGVTIAMITHDDAVARRAQRRFQVSDGCVLESVEFQKVGNSNALD